jgi:hypothetical protein
MDRRAAGVKESIAASSACAGRRSLGEIDSPNAANRWRLVPRHRASPTRPWPTIAECYDAAYSDDEDADGSLRSRLIRSLWADT